MRTFTVQQVCLTGDETIDEIANTQRVVEEIYKARSLHLVPGFAALPGRETTHGG